MSDYWVCCDNIDGNENSRINALCEALKKNGHNATNGGVGPNTIQSHGLTSASKGQIGVFIVGGSDAGMYVDFRDGLKRGYYHYKYMWVVFASETATTDKWITCNGLANTPLVRAHDDNYSGSNIESVGSSAKSFFDANKEYIGYACGKKGCSFDDVIQNFLNGANAGDTNSDSSSGSTIKSAICDVMYNWDGEAELFIRDETVYIHKIKSPLKAELSLIEGENIHLNSITINDYNPSTVNYLTCIFEDYELTIQDESRIKRFGKVPSEVSIGEDVKNLEDAKEFLQREWNKLQRDNDHSLECTVRGNSKWQVGEWCRVYLPTFNLDGFMYIINMSQDDSASDKWNCKLTLVDYPPSFGKPSVNENNSEETDNLDTDSMDVTTEGGVS